MRVEKIINIASVLQAIELKIENPRQASYALPTAPETVSIRRSFADTNEYSFEVLNNGMRVLLVQNSAFSKAGCGVAIDAGNFDEPTDFRGLAHFVEHVLFNNSQKYPALDSFNSFIGQHSGDTNAMTSGNATAFYFTVASLHLEEAADRFVDMLVAPVFDVNNVDCVLEILQSESKMLHNNSGWLSYVLSCRLFNETRPESGYTCGDQNTLGKEGLLEAAAQFWRTNYVGEKMSLVVSGSAEICDLRKIAKMFEVIKSSGVPAVKKGTANQTYNLADQLWKESVQSRVVRFRPVGDEKIMRICTVISPQTEHFKINAIGYITRVLSDTGRGSLLSQLVNARLAFEMSVDHINERDCTRVFIAVKLTDLGHSEYKTVVSMIHQFLLTLKARWDIYSRLWVSADDVFRHRPQDTLDNIVSNYPTYILNYPIEHLIDHQYMYDDFDEAFINSCIASISDPECWCIMLPDQSIDPDVEYVVGEACAECLGHSTILDDPFDEKCVIEGERHLNTKQYENGEVTFVFDSELRTPTVILQVEMISADVQENSSVYMIYFVGMMQLFKETYARELEHADMSLQVFETLRGVTLGFVGISEMVPAIVKLFFEHIMNISVPVDEVTDGLWMPKNKFELVKDEITGLYRDLEGALPVHMLKTVLFDTILGRKGLTGKAAEVKALSIGQIRVSRDIFCSILAVGNARFEDIASVLDFISTKYLANRPLKPVETQSKDVDVVEFRTSDKVNNAIGLFYKVNGERVGGEDISRRLYNSILGKLIYLLANPLIFTELRSKECLGYIVHCVRNIGLEHEYLGFVVQSEKPVEYLEERIVRFVASLKQHILNMSEQELLIIKKSFICELEEKPTTLEKFFVSIQRQKERGLIVLNPNEIIAMVEGITLEDLRKSDILDKYIRVSSYRE